MKKIFIILFLLLVPFPKSAYAESSVNVTNKNNSNCQTDVSITTNGQTKSFHSTDCSENVDLQSSDGTSKVSIHNQTGSNAISFHPTVLPTRSVTIIPRNLDKLSTTPAATASPTQKPSDGEKSKLHQSFLDRIFQHLQFLKAFRIDSIKKLFPSI